MPLIVLRGLLFDLDGTLTRPRLDFRAIRREIGVPDGASILEFLDGLHGPDLQTATDILDRHEMQSARLTEPNDGYAALMNWLSPQRERWKIGIITRNSRPAATVALQMLGFPTDVLISREDAPPKPAPDAVHLAMERLGLLPLETIFAGDFRYDIEAGKAAGVAMTVFVSNRDPNAHPADADAVVNDLAELTELLRAVTEPL